MARGAGPELSGRRRHRRGGWWDVLAWLAVVAATAATIHGWLANGTSSWQSPLTLHVVVALATTVVCLAASAWLRFRWRLAGDRGLLVLTVAVWSPTWAAARWVPPEAVVPLVAAGAFVASGVVLVVARTSGASLRWREGAGTFGPAGLAAAVTMAAYSPFDDPRCQDGCDVVGPGPLVGMWDSEPVSMVVATLAAASAVGSLVVVTARASALPPGALGGALTGSAAAFAVYIAQAASWGLMGGVPEQVEWTLAPAAAVATGVLVTAARTRRTRQRLERIVARLAGSTDKSDATTLHFALPEGGWVDHHGREVSEDAEGFRLIADAPTGKPLARFADAGEARMEKARPEASWDAGQWLALENARAGAIVRAHQRQVIDSQRRIVSLSDAERRRMERDLHDGVQQRLVSAKLHLALARNRTPSQETEDSLARAEDRVQSGLEGLREVSRGLAPRALSTAGLASALHDLADRGAVPVEVKVGGTDGLTLDLRTAAYVVAADLVEHAERSGTERVWVTASIDELSGVEVTVAAATRMLQAEDPDLVALGDRVGALGGTIELDDDGCQVRAVIPCES